MSLPADFATQVAAAQPMLLKYATLQLRNVTWAQDVVSDVVLAALEKPHAFSGKSSLNTWLVGILKFKIIDHFRRNARETIASSDDNDEQFDELHAHWFDGTGHGTQPPTLWTEPATAPDASLQEKQFFAVLETCVRDLPEQQGRVFMMREWLELSTDDICKELGLNSSNLWVLLHRARTRLQACLGSRWFVPT